MVENQGFLEYFGESRFFWKNFVHPFSGEPEAKL